MKIRVGWSVNLSDFFTCIQLVNFHFLKAKQQSEAICGSVHRAPTTKQLSCIESEEHHIFQRFLLFLCLKDDFLVFALHFYPRGNILKASGLNVWSILTFPTKFLTDHPTDSYFQSGNDAK